MNDTHIDISIAGGGKKKLAVVFKNMPRARNFKMWIDSDGNLILSKPSRVSKSEALEFAKKNADWIKTQLQSWKPKTPLSERLRNNPVIYADNSEWRAYLQEAKASAFTVLDNVKHEVVFSFKTEEELRKLFVKFAFEKLQNAAEQTAENANLHFKKISVRDQAGRWASMSTTGTLSVNWRVILLPCQLQTYIFSHELAHTIFMDHSVSFWIFLNKICPSAKKLDAATSKLAKELFSIG